MSWQLDTYSLELIPDTLMLNSQRHTHYLVYWVTVLSVTGSVVFHKDAQL